MAANVQLEQEQKAPLANFLLYFLQLGTIGFGGPIALASRMESELVEDRRWIKREDYLQGLAFAQLAPGPLAAQLAMYLGYVRAAIACLTLLVLWHWKVPEPVIVLSSGIAGLLLSPSIGVI
jgi:chromate transporter